MSAVITTQVLAPLSGRILILADVPDPVFANGFVGHGGAIRPPQEAVDVVAPIGGTVKALFPHAFVISSSDEVNVLVHLGLDTAQLAGAGFTARTHKGARVEAGEPLMTYNVPLVEAAGHSPIVPVTFLEQHPESVRLVASVAPGSTVASGDPFLTLGS
ncbi:MAG: PTS glucose transporter subunit IIA [Propioniciclava sp.]